jgi:putative ABC transport system permease protein
MLVKLAPGDLKNPLKCCGKHGMKSLLQCVDYSFLDEDVEMQYASYDRWMSKMGFSNRFRDPYFFAGLFGLSGINAINRTKEIGFEK